MGRCTAWKCPRQAPAGFKRCNACRRHIRMLAQAISQQRRRQRLCLCGRTRAPGRKSCQECLDYWSGRLAELQESRRLDGLCPKCGAKPRDEHVLCERCRAAGRRTWAAIPRAKRRRIHRERRARSPEAPGAVAARVAACKARWRAAGRCITCGKPAAIKQDKTRSAHCRKHLQLRAAARARRRERAKEKD